MLVRFQTVLFSQEGWAEKRSVQFGHRQCSLRCGECGSAHAGKVEADSRSSVVKHPSGVQPSPDTGRHPAPQRYCCVKSCRRPALPTTGGRRQCSAVTPAFLHNRKEHLRATGSLPNPPGKLLQQVLFSVLWRNQLAVATAILRG